MQTLFFMPSHYHFTIHGYSFRNILIFLLEVLQVTPEAIQLFLVMGSVCVFLVFWAHFCLVFPGIIMSRVVFGWSVFQFLLNFLSFSLFQLISNFYLLNNQLICVTILVSSIVRLFFFMVICHFASCFYFFSCAFKIIPAEIWSLPPCVCLTRLAACYLHLQIFRLVWK